MNRDGVGREHQKESSVRGVLKDVLLFTRALILHIAHFYIVCLLSVFLLCPSCTGTCCVDGLQVQRCAEG